ncbi:MAG: hypothetical protein U0838_14575 [Chloroflexota bacterium]
MNPDAEREIDGEPGDSDEALKAEGRDVSMAEIARLGVQESIDVEDGADVDGETISPDAWSKGEVIRRDFDRMTAAELRDAERFVISSGHASRSDERAPPQLHPHGRRLAPRAPCTGATSRQASSPSGSGAARSRSRASSWSCATSRAPWSATRGCCCASSRRLRERTMPDQIVRQPGRA